MFSLLFVVPQLHNALECELKSPTMINISLGGKFVTIGQNITNLGRITLRDVHIENINSHIFT